MMYNSCQSQSTFTAVASNKKIIETNSHCSAARVFFDYVSFKQAKPLKK